MNNLQYIVTGTGRCGTNFVAKMLTKLDIPCGHECIFDFEPLDKIIKKIYHPHLRKLSFCSTHNLELKSETYEELEQWVDAEKTIADSSYMAAPYLNMPILNHVKIIHIVRNPIKVISSFLKSLNYFNDSNPNNEWEQKIFETLPELKKINNPIERACYYYINWNNLIEKKSNKDNTIICKIENIINNLYFYKFINKEKTEINLPNNVNTINKRIEDFKIKDIPSGSIKKDFLNTINKYGYL